MNARQQKAQMHARTLRAAKESLMQAVNRQLQSFRAKGYEAEVTPQVLRLLSLEQFRQRDVQQMNRLANNPEKLKEYILAFDSETGEVISGEAAINRYNRYATSKIAKPAKQIDVVRDNVVDAIDAQFVDETAYNLFTSMLGQFMGGDYSGVKADDWGGLKNEHDRSYVTAYNRDHYLRPLASAFNRAVERDGETVIMDRLSRAGSLADDLTAAAVSGYKEKAQAALYSLLELLNPGASAQEMGAMQEAYEAQFEGSEFEE